MLCEMIVGEGKIEGEGRMRGGRDADPAGRTWGSKEEVCERKPSGGGARGRAEKEGAPPRGPRK